MLSTLQDNSRPGLPGCVRGGCTELSAASPGAGPADEGAEEGARRCPVCMVSVLAPAEPEQMKSIHLPRLHKGKPRPFFQPQQATSIQPMSQGCSCPSLVLRPGKPWMLAALPLLHQQHSLAPAGPSLFITRLLYDYWQVNSATAAPGPCS